MLQKPQKTCHYDFHKYAIFHSKINHTLLFVIKSRIKHVHILIISISILYIIKAILCAISMLLNLNKMPRFML